MRRLACLCFLMRLIKTSPEMESKTAKVEAGPTSGVSFGLGTLMILVMIFLPFSKWMVSSEEVTGMTSETGSGP